MKSLTSNANEAFARKFMEQLQKEVTQKENEDLRVIAAIFKNANWQIIEKIKEESGMVDEEYKQAMADFKERERLKKIIRNQEKKYARSQEEMRSSQEENHRIIEEKDKKIAMLEARILEMEKERIQ